MTKELKALADAILPVTDAAQKYARLKDAAKALIDATDIGRGHIHYYIKQCGLCCARNELIAILEELE